MMAFNATRTRPAPRPHGTVPPVRSLSFGNNFNHKIEEA